jgi:plasmid stabilization system protein ParE
LTAVRKSQQFEEDYTAAALYLAIKNPAASLNFLDAVDAAVELLGAHPEMGPVWRYSAPDNPTRYLLLPGFHNYMVSIATLAVRSSWDGCSMARKICGTFLGSSFPVQ